MIPRRLSFHRLLLTSVIHVVSHPKRILAIAGIVLAACIAVSALHLSISTDQDQLFSRDVPFFKDYISFTKAFPENQAAYVLIEARDRAHLPTFARWTDCADAITDRLNKNTTAVASADSHVPVDELRGWGMLFDDPKNLSANLADAQRMLPLAQLWGEAPTAITRLLGASPLQRFVAGVSAAPDAESATFTQLLADGWTQSLTHISSPIQVGDQVPDLSSLGASDPSRLGYYYMADDSDPTNHLLLVRVYEQTKYTSMRSLADTIESIRVDVRAVGKDFPEFKMALTGRPVLEADEMATTDADSRRAEIAALITIFIGLVIVLRSLWLGVAAEIALLVGIGWTFGWAWLTIGQLNLLSLVFLIALIGIGMDYLIQILSRYRQEAARHDHPRIIWTAVFRHVSAPINTACLGAAGAFFVSVFTDFRGAAELGIIASGGLLLCLLAGYVILPALLTIFPARIIAAPERADEPPMKHSRAWLLTLPCLWSLLLLIGSPFAWRAHFDPSLLNMQNPDLESVKLVSKLQTWSAVELSTDLDQLRRVRQAVANLPSVRDTESILTAYDNYDWLKAHAEELPNPNWSSPTEIAPAQIPAIIAQARALADRMAGLTASATQPGKSPVEFVSSAASLRAFADLAEHQPADVVAKRLSSWQTVFVDHLKTLLAPFHPPPLIPGELPKSLREHLIGGDGRYALYINPRKNLWKQADLAEFVAQVEHAVQSVAGAPAATGIAINIYHSTASIEKSFYKAAGYALVLIVILVAIDLRSARQTLLAVSVLALGLPMLVILMGYFKVSWNFANFFGLPILIGAGHEYGVFMVHRYNEVVRDPRRLWRRWDVSDIALALCAFVTTFSFGYFWALGHHRGLKSLGLVMWLGTLCIYLATICVVRPLLRWHLEARGLGRGSEENGA